MDSEALVHKALEKNLITPDQLSDLSQQDIYDFIFHPGFTTKAQADDFSGRGVGMDVVRTALGSIRGTITIDSALGKVQRLPSGYPSPSISAALYFVSIATPALLCPWMGLKICRPTPSTKWNRKAADVIFAGEILDCGCIPQ